ncbi:MltA domain-containing protein, partial [Methyloceanibacter marginalis]|uniref:MltA domain-containing protein n=1 Tax=Methyloceanibacter marginalis TaxID=1774971 RepID=UPI001FCDFE3B
LALAVVLKSPLFGLDDDSLFDLAYDRKLSLWARLKEKAGTDPRFVEAAKRIAAWLGQADILPPYEFFSALLGADGQLMRKRMLTRLGPEAAEAIDEFLDAALAYDRDEAPSLQGFVNQLRAGDIEIKRDMEQDRDEVRIMTVHGAKGLQAPIVFLPDTCVLPRAQGPRLFPVPRLGRRQTKSLISSGHRGAPVSRRSRREGDGAAGGDRRRRPRGQGLELLYLDDPIELFFMQVQGSGRVRFPDGSWVRLGYAAKNGHAYTSIGKLLAERGEKPPGGLTMEGLKSWLRADAARGRALMHENKSYVFFRVLPEDEANDGPVGAQASRSRPAAASRSMPPITRSVRRSSSQPLSADAGRHTVPPADDCAGRGLRHQRTGTRRHLLGLRRGSRRHCRGHENASALLRPAAEVISGALSRALRGFALWSAAKGTPDGQARHEYRGRRRTLGPGGSDGGAAQEEEPRRPDPGTAKARPATKG